MFVNIRNGKSELQNSLKSVKITWIVWNTISFNFKNFSNSFGEYIKMKNLDERYKKYWKNIVKKYVK